MTAVTPSARLDEAAATVHRLPAFAGDPVAAILLAKVFDRIGFVVRFDPDMLHRVGNAEVLALADHVLASQADGASS